VPDSAAEPRLEGSGARSVGSGSRSEGGILPGPGLPPLPEPLPTPVLDSHCHLDLSLSDEPGRPPAPEPDLGEALALASAVGVPDLVQVGCDLAGSAWAVVAAERFDRIVATVAIHPNEAPRIAAEGGRAALEAAWLEIDRLASSPRVRGVGETGLDYFRTGVEGRNDQEESFRRHIDIAKRHRKALVIHDRDAHDAVLRVLRDEGPPEIVVFHCFSGDRDMARACVEAGWYLSFAGTVTFKNAEPLREALRVVPASQILVETDAPFLAPVPYRGRPNASYLIPWTVRAMAAVKAIDLDELCAAIGASGRRIFGL
jgi:TatD DNase family protein